MDWSKLDEKQKENMLLTLFSGYQKQKDEGILHIKGKFDIPKNLIRIFYSLDESKRRLNDLTDNFIKKYIECEAILEGSHNHNEKAGMSEMYNYIHSKEIDEDFSIYTLLDLHTKLYSVMDSGKEDDEKFGGHTRTVNCHINGSRVNFSDYTNIWRELKDADYDLQYIRNLALQIPDDKEKLFDYIEACVRLKCKLIKTHPFPDGNGRSIRGFINKLFLNVGLPSIYISANEDDKYREAMNKALGDDSDDCAAIIQFYYYKICDSILELNINPKLYNEVSIHKLLIKQAKELRQTIEREQVSLDLWNDEISHYIYLRFINDGFDCAIHNTNEEGTGYFNHYYITISYQGKKEIKEYILDPMFYSLINIDTIDMEDDNSFIDSLAEYGVASFSDENKKIYLKSFEKSQKLGENKKQI